MIWAWHLPQRRWSFPSSPLSFDYKIVAHLILRAEPLHLSACISHKCVHPSAISDSLRPDGLQPARLLCLWNSPGKNTRVGSHFLLQEIFPTKRSNLGLLHCRQIIYRLNHWGAHCSHVSYIKKSTSSLSLCLLLNSFCTETQRTWTSISPGTRWVILIKTGFRSQSEFWPDSSPSTWVQVPIWGAWFQSPEPVNILSYLASRILQAKD